MTEFHRPFDDGQPGRKDINGIEWWACDPYPTWYRWVDGELQLGPSGAWADPFPEDATIHLDRDGTVFTREVSRIRDSLSVLKGIYLGPRTRGAVFDILKDIDALESLYDQEREPEEVPY